MNPQLPEIVERVKVTRASLNRRHEVGPMILRKGYGPPGYADRYEWVWQDGQPSLIGCSDEDAENACVVALLGRLMRNNHIIMPMSHQILIRESAGSTWEKAFPGDLLSALYAAFQAHPEWFQENRT